MALPRAVAIIQARMQSTRLPGKSLLPLSGRPLIAHVIERSRMIDGVCAVVLAIPDDADSGGLERAGREAGAEIFKGSADDVLDRYYQAMRLFNADYVVRVTGDNPFTDPGHASETLGRAFRLSTDLCAPSDLPLGTAVEVIKSAALERAWIEAGEPHHREHVSPFIKERTERFFIERFKTGCRSPFQDIRLTVDTDEDYRLASRLYDALHRGRPFPLDEVLAFLENNPSLIEINRHVEQRTMRHSERGGA